ncbi:MAG: elongation factor 1-beta [Hadesarchaea archaeon]|nr:MAG: elongation factor 1-beta [Hadesarchaea archaeon]TDA36523.1 MAG: elongation factor 1-beta [Hadesarchaea archaeon]
MGKVAVTVRVMPEGTEVNLEELERRIRELAEVVSLSREPIAFGLEALLLVAVVPDAAGGTEPLERALQSLPGVGSVQVVGITLV